MSIHPQGEVRPTVTYADLEPAPIPLLRLRDRDRSVIPPEACLVGPRCLVCRWRGEGLLDHPVAKTPVVREASLYGVPADGHVCQHCSYALGREHGLADGPDQRPDAEWLAEAGLDVPAYLRGYDEGCRECTLTLGTPLWDAADAALDGLPF